MLLPTESADTGFALFEDDHLPRIVQLVSMRSCCAIGFRRKDCQRADSNRSLNGDDIETDGLYRVAVSSWNRSESFEKNDLAMASQVWANDESLTIFESGHANYGWADYRDHHLVPEMGEMKNTKYAFSDIKIHLAGKTAWATLKYTISADVMENGKPRHVDGGGLGTAVLENREGQWRIVLWLFPPPPPPPPPPRHPKIKKGFLGSHGNNRKLFAPKSFEICCTQEELICEEPQVF